ncbi:Putative beta-lactamase hcpC precursor [Moraxella caprae]|uniref:Beta-lactamase hcpC n=2 Tax=Moraxella caprae TaxID=90240 RepID=A0A378R2M6_9GAMM|nr:tetratricopeptide repeat protein [Moraxella caprae]STZ08110.1 Putative beta-lactamase hcpC precursor [Moraxella caprae]
MFKKLSLLTAGLLLSVSVFANDLQDLIKKEKNGDIESQIELVDYYRHNQDNVNYLHWLEKVAYQGNKIAQYNLGQAYRVGDIVKQDYAQAIEWYLKSANQNYSESQFVLGSMYEHALGVERDYQKAMEWYLRASDNYHQEAMYNIGVMYDMGMGG